MITRQNIFIFTSVFILSILVVMPALAQTPSTSNPPVISDIKVENITQSAAMISWNTDTPATTRLDYGVTTNYENASIIDPGLRTFHQIQVSPLDAATTYHYRPRSTDASGRERVSADRVFTTKTVPDSSPPGPIDSLQIASSTVTSLILAWTAPGGDGSVGTSSSYEIRASSKTIPEIGALQWWEAATILTGAPTPNGAGAKEAYTARNLATSTKYYFGIRARDTAGNISSISISDIRSGMTLPAPPAVPVPAPTPIFAASSTPPAVPVNIGSAATTTPPRPGGTGASTGTPTVSSGQAAGIGTTPSAATPATLIAGNLSYGMRSESVKIVQKILIAKGFLSAGNDSGFFGSLTKRAVQKFQCTEKIVCSGSPRTTGYGSVGAKTRLKLNGI